MDSRGKEGRGYVGYTNTAMINIRDTQILILLYGGLLTWFTLRGSQAQSGTSQEQG